MIISVSLAVKFLQQLEQNRGCFLARFQSQRDLQRGEDIRDRSQSLQQFGKARIGFLVRKKAGVKGHEFQTKLPGQNGGGLDVFEILLPSRVGRDASGGPDGFQRGVILPHAAEHARDDGDAVLAKERGRLAPNRGGFAQWIEGELDPGDARGLQFGNQILRAAGLQRPTAHCQALYPQIILHARGGHSDVENS